MSLAKASDDRKARLQALRQRKAGESTDGVYVRMYSFPNQSTHSFSSCSEVGSILKSRNFDPESRTIKKRVRGGEDVEMQDTVEKDVQGLAENIIIEDEQNRAQELVSAALHANSYPGYLNHLYR